MHQELIQVKEASARDLRELRGQLSQLENEKADLKFLVSQSEHKLAEQRQELNGMQRKLGEALKASQYK